MANGIKTRIKANKRTAAIKALVELADGTIHTIPRLLGWGQDNPKTKKNGITTVYISVTPHRVEGLGNMCPYASEGPDGCADPCLHNSGRTMGESPSADMIRRGRLARRKLYFKHRDVFMAMYHREMPLAVARAEKRGHTLVARLNVLADWDWYAKHPEMITRYPSVQFYDYTKDQLKYERFLRGEYAPNYHLTFSRDGHWNEPKCLEYLAKGGSVTAVFKVKYNPSNGTKDLLPATYLGYPVIDGDESDLRFLDPKGCWIGLRAKGKARTRKPAPGAFVIDMPCQP